MKIFNQNKKKNNNEEMTKQDQIKNGIMLVLMILFFAALVIPLRNSNNKEPNNNSNNKNNKPNNNIIDNNNESSIKGINYLKDNNYAYIYTFELPEYKEKITGKIYNNKEKFTIINNNQTIEAARLGNDYLILQNGNFQFTNVPSDNLKYANIKNLQALLEMSIFEEKEGKITYEIDPIDTLDIYAPDILYDEFANYNSDSVSIYYQNDYITKIKIDFNNYQSIVTGNNKNTLKIVLEYFDYQKQEDFDIK